MSPLADFPATGKSARTTRTPGVFRGTKGSNPPPSSGESIANSNLGRRQAHSGLDLRHRLSGMVILHRNILAGSDDEWIEVGSISSISSFAGQCIIEEVDAKPSSSSWSSKRWRCRLSWYRSRVLEFVRLRRREKDSNHRYLPLRDGHLSPP